MQVLKYPAEKILEALDVPVTLIKDYEIAAKKRLRKSRWGSELSDDGKRDLLKKLQGDALAQLEPLVSDKNAFSRLEQEIFPPDTRFRLIPMPNRVSAAGAAMGMAAGGRIKQKIVQDPFGIATWDSSVKGSIFIHLVNSAFYKEITGQPPPYLPIKAIHYHRLGIPWFNYYDDHLPSVGPSPILSNVKSILAVDQKRGKITKIDEAISIDAQKIVEIKIPTRMERVQSLLSATQAAARNGASKSVVRLTTAILDLQDDFVPAISLRAEAHLQLGYYDEAKCDADHVIKISKDNEISVIARCVRAKVALLTGVPEMALLEAKAAVLVSGTNPTLAAIIEKANAMLCAKSH